MAKPACRQAGWQTNMWYVYILYNPIRKISYKGLTNNIDRRLLEHESGQNKKTRYLRPFDLIHVEICSDRFIAREVEKYFKSGYGREIIKELCEYARVAKLADAYA